VKLLELGLRSTEVAELARRLADLEAELAQQKKPWDDERGRVS
jgi:hypothetical protein